MMLSILIPTIPERKGKLNVLLNELERQRVEFDRFHSTLGTVEFLVDDGKRFIEGGLSIGKKREKLVRSASGKYLCFLDDDESVSPNYVEQLMRLCIQDKDVCTFRAIIKMQEFWTLLDMSLLTKENQQLTPNGIVTRPPWHVCPVRSVYAKMFYFEDINAAEDSRWMEQVLTLCNNEAHTDMILFQYNHKTESEADNLIKLGYAYGTPPMGMNL